MGYIWDILRPGGEGQKLPGGGDILTPPPGINPVYAPDGYPYAHIYIYKTEEFSVFSIAV